MAASALIKFTQGATVGEDGQSLKGGLAVDDGEVFISNVDNADVASWQIDFVYAEPASSLNEAVPYAFHNNSSTPNASFEPDVPGCYRFVLKVWDVPNRVGTPTSVDIRIFAVPEASGFVIPPSQLWPLPLPDPQSGETNAKPNEFNFGGQLYGWSGNGVNDGLINHFIRSVLETPASGALEPIPTVWFVDPQTEGTQTGAIDHPYESVNAAIVAANAENLTTLTLLLAPYSPGVYSDPIEVDQSEGIVNLTIQGLGTDFQTEFNGLVWSGAGECQLTLRNVNNINGITATGASLSTLNIERSRVFGNSTGLGRVEISNSTITGSISCTSFSARDGGIGTVTASSNTVTSEIDSCVIRGGADYNIALDTFRIRNSRFFSSGSVVTFTGPTGLLFIDASSEWSRQDTGATVSNGSVTVMTVDAGGEIGGYNLAEQVLTSLGDELKWRTPATRRILVVPTVGYWKQGEVLLWGVDNVRYGIRPKQTGALGYSARVDDTPYIKGDLITADSRIFVCVSPGTSDSSEPVDYTGAPENAIIEDGDAIFMCVSEVVQGPDFSSIPLPAATPVLLADGSATIQISDGPVRILDTATGNNTTTLGIDDAILDDIWTFIRLGTEAYSWGLDATGTGGDSILITAGSRATVSFYFNGTTYKYHRHTGLLS